MENVLQGSTMFVDSFNYIIIVDKINTIYKNKHGCAFLELWALWRPEKGKSPENQHLHLFSGVIT